MTTNVGVDQHVAVPTKGQTVVHDGPYSTGCPKCIEVVRSVLSRPLAVNGVPVAIGSPVRPVLQAVGSHHPEWGTVSEIRYNSHSGEIWIFCWEYGNVILRLADIAEARWPEHLLMGSVQRLAAALMATDVEYHITQGDTLVNARTKLLLDRLAHQETAPVNP